MYRALIVGCGNIAARFDECRPEDALPLTHAGAYRRHGGFRIEGCIDPDESRRAAFMAYWEVPHGAASWHDAAREEIDVISICSPTEHHEEDIEAALARRPKLIFCEKPLTPSAARSEACVARCADAGVKLAVNHTRRWAPDIVGLKGQLKEGKWGALRGARAVYTKGILNNGSHMIDLLRFLLEEELTLVAAGPSLSDYKPADPTVPALLETASGAAVQLSVADARDYARFELELIMERGVIAMEEGGLSWRTRTPVDSSEFQGYTSLSAGEVRSGRYFEAMLAAVTNIERALSSGERLASTGKTALQAQQLCEAIAATATAKEDRV